MSVDVLDPAIRSGNDLVLQSDVTALIDSRNSALKEYSAMLKVYKDAAQLGVELLRSVNTAVPRVFQKRKVSDAAFLPGLDDERSVKSFRMDIDRHYWAYLIERFRLNTIMDATAYHELIGSLDDDPPLFTLENVTSTFQNFLENSHEIMLRGIAKSFSDLDRRFKSHDGFKIGSRIILTNVFCRWSGGIDYGATRQKLIDVERCFAVVDGENPDGDGFISAIRESRGGFDPHQSEVDTPYMKIRGFKNGNAHLWFSRHDLVAKVNLMLAEYYGEVIGDGVDRHGQSDKPTGTALTTGDLQFYPTPSGVIERVLRDVHMDGKRVLEPSAGEGAMAVACAKAGALVTAIEIDRSRASRIEEKNVAAINVVCRNFLTIQPAEMQPFDLVVMNPPFSRTHWIEHVRHAFDMLKPGGRLIAILPITADLGESAQHKRFRAWLETVAKKAMWRDWFTDLPAGSFKTSGTNINTVQLDIFKL